LKIDEHTKFNQTWTNSFEIVEHIKKCQAINVAEVTNRQELQETWCCFLDYTEGMPNENNQNDGNAITLVLPLRLIK
jgi:hypothetical protein